MSNDTSKEYDQWMKEFYKENQSFLNKAIFGISALAIPFLFEALKSNNIWFGSEIMLLISLLGFLAVICFQMSSLKAARDGCDKSLEQDKKAIEKGERLFNKARAWDIWRERFFILSLFLIVIALFSNIIQKEILACQEVIMENVK